MPLRGWKPRWSAHGCKLAYSIREYEGVGFATGQRGDEWPVICSRLGGGVGRRCGSARRVIKYLHCHRRSCRLIPELIVFHFIQRLRVARPLSAVDKHGTEDHRVTFCSTASHYKSRDLRLCFFFSFPFDRAIFTSNMQLFGQVSRGSLAGQHPAFDAGTKWTRISRATNW